MTITSNDMLSDLMSLDTLSEKLSVGDVLDSTTLFLDGSEKVKFNLPLGWNVGLKEAPGTELTAATMTTGNKERQMTKDALLALTTMVGIRREYVCKTPGPMIQDHLNYWAQHTDKSVKALHGKDGVVAVTKPGITPFSNIELLDSVVEGLQQEYGVGRDAILADYKFTHDLRQTSFRLIVPEHVRAISSHRADGSEDQWSTGIQVRNSLVGETPLSVHGYLFAWWCTNGAISTHSTSSKYNRRTQGQEAGEVYAWARDTVDSILGGLEHELDAVTDLTTTPIEGEVHAVLADVFTEYKVPMKAREDIITNLVEIDDLSMYGVMNAITQAANQVDRSDKEVTSLMEIGGDLPRASSSRCEACHRLAVVPG